MFQFSDFFDPLSFLIAFSIGLFYTYLFTPTPEIIIKYPTPENSGKIIYKDRADVCYKYMAEEVACPADKSNIKNLELQHNRRSSNPLAKFINDKIDNIFPSK